MHRRATHNRHQDKYQLHIISSLLKHTKTYIMSIIDNIIMPTTCANCGKGEEESVALKNCVACKMVKYCGRDCQKAHRPQHKNECRLRAAELHDEALFKYPPKDKDCPICFMRMPTLETGRRYQTCCGKLICSRFVELYPPNQTRR